MTGIFYIDLPDKKARIEYINMKLKNKPIFNIDLKVNDDARLFLQELLNNKNNIIEGTVISAVALTAKKVKELEETLSKKYNKNITLENKVDKSILGGVLVRLGNIQIDGSVKTRLDNIKDQLSQVIS